jgi:hypothetical protein
MGDAVRKNEPEAVPLAQAGIPRPQVEWQLQKLLRSPVLEGKRSEKDLLQYLVRESLAGNLLRLRVPVITDVLFGKYDPGSSRARQEAKKLRKTLAVYYSSREASPGELRFTIPAKGYVVYAPKATGEIIQTEVSKPQDGPVARIFDPATNAEVHQRIAVRGRIEVLDLDLRAWLVIKSPSGQLYPQCRVRRNNQDWQEEVRVGHVQWGSEEGIGFEIQLVSADAEGDYSFYHYLKSDREGFGTVMPGDCELLDAVRVIRRDIRNKV